MPVEPKRKNIASTRLGSNLSTIMRGRQTRTSDVLVTSLNVEVLQGNNKSVSGGTTEVLEGRVTQM